MNPLSMEESWTMEDDREDRVTFEERLVDRGWTDRRTWAAEIALEPGLPIEAYEKVGLLFIGRLESFLGTGFRMVGPITTNEEHDFPRNQHIIKVHVTVVPDH